ncbi:MAG TPA: LLM class flavin-dependent oxidoreductase, partial [Novosphingobium sp.]|nr:LLM class flavin-dependent oxidoreductase [Novosphingobium sp.]
VKFPPVICKPLPARSGGPPVLFGVPNSPDHLKVAARHYDGWIANGAGPGSIAKGRDILYRACERIGRDPSELKIYAMGFDMTQETLAAYERAGVDMVVGALYNHPGTALSLEQRAELHKHMVYDAVPIPEHTLDVLDKLARLSGVSR